MEFNAIDSVYVRHIYVLPFLPWQPAGHRFFAFLCTGQAPANLSTFLVGDGERCSDSKSGSDLSTFSFLGEVLEGNFFFLEGDWSSQVGQNQFPFGISLNGGSKQ